MALAIVRGEAEYAVALSEALAEVHSTLQLCERCADLSPTPLCERCSDSRRDSSVICVVAQPQDRMAIERTGVFRGTYHVLHGVLDPLSGVGPSELKIDLLLRRLEARDPPVAEVIVATSPNVEGDATALYIAKLAEEANAANMGSNIKIPLAYVSKLGVINENNSK